MSAFFFISFRKISFTVIRKKSNVNKLESNDVNKFQIKEFKLKEVEIEKNKELFISLKYSDWDIKGIAPNKLRLIKKENCGPARKRMPLKVAIRTRLSTSDL